MKNKTILFFMYVSIFLIFIIPTILAFNAESSSYTSENKIDSFANSNATSTSFYQRLVGGIQTVGKYVSTAFNGRFGILGESELIINISSHNQNDKIVRGNDVVSGEDNKGYIPNFVNFTARVFDNSSNAGFLGATCYFYDGDSLFGNSLTNSSGHCTHSLTKDSFAVSSRNISINFSISTDDIILIKEDFVNIFLIRYITELTTGNKRTSGCSEGGSCYHNGDKATLDMNISKINESATFQYDPNNISTNATNAAETVYFNGTFRFPGNITRLDVGEYHVNITVNSSFGLQVRWDVLVSDNSFVDFISTTVHSDVEICAADWGAFSDFSACSNGQQTRSRTDSSGCTDVETQSCTSGDTTPPPGGGGGGCTRGTLSEWSEYGICGEVIPDKEVSTRTNGECIDTRFRPCGCVKSSCGEWSECTLPNEELSFNDPIQFQSLSFEPLFTKPESIDLREEPVLVMKKVINIKEIENPELQQSVVTENSYYRKIADFFNSDDVKYYFNSFNSITGKAVSTFSSCENLNDVGNIQCRPNRDNQYQECIERTRGKKTSAQWKNNKCDRGLVCGDGLCVNPTNCEITSATWDKTNVIETDVVTLTLIGEGSGCEGEIIKFRVFEDDLFNDESVKINPTDTAFASGIATTTWISEYQEDGIGDPEYYFNAVLASDSSTKIKSDLLSVSKLIIPPTCGDNIIESGEVCDGNNQICTVAGYVGIETCNIQCNAFEPCTTIEYCGDGIRNGNEGCDDGNLNENDFCINSCNTAICGDGKVQLGVEQCDDNNNLNGDGCSVSCELELINGTIGNQTNNGTEFDPLTNLTEGQVLLALGEQIEVTINEGDKLSVTYEELRNDLVLLNIRRITTTSSTPAEETHTIVVNKIENNLITVTVTSAPITRQIPVGGTEVFNFGEEFIIPPSPSGGGGSSSSSSGSSSSDGGGVTGSGLPGFSPPDQIQTGNGVQSHVCRDLCQPTYVEGSTWTETKECILGFVEFLPQNRFLIVAPNQEVDFSGDIQQLAGTQLSIEWFLDSFFQKGDSAVTNLFSAFSVIFTDDSVVDANAIAGSQSQDETWQITINPDADLNCGGEDWFCKWTFCDESGFQYTSEEFCDEINDCGTNVDLPLKRACDCIPVYDCESWSACGIDYNIGDILQGEPTINGKQTRVCQETNGCELEPQTIVESQECNLGSNIRVENKEWCFEQYTHIYDAADDSLVARFRERVIGNTIGVDIGILVTAFEGVCGYCFDGVKNFDETGIDCGGSGCVACTDRSAFFDYVFYIKLGLWILFFLLLEYYSYKNRTGTLEIFKPKLKKPKFKLPKITLPKLKIRRAHKVIPKKVAKPIVYRPRTKIIERIKIIELIRPKIPNPFADLRKMLKRWKGVPMYATPIKEMRLKEAIIKKRKDLKNKRRIRKLERVVVREKRARSKIIRKHQKKKRKVERRARKREHKIVKRKSKDLKKQLKKWKSQGYTNTPDLQRELDKLGKK